MHFLLLPSQKSARGSSYPCQILTWGLPAAPVMPSVVLVHIRLLSEHASLAMSSSSTVASYILIYLWLCNALKMWILMWVCRCGYMDQPFTDESVILSLNRCPKSILGEHRGAF